MQLHMIGSGCVFFTKVSRKEIDRLGQMIGTPERHIPLGGVEPDEQACVIRNGCPHDHDAVETLTYEADAYATDDGEQGWCCGFCGRILDVRRIAGRRRRRSPGGPRA